MILAGLGQSFLQSNQLAEAITSAQQGLAVLENVDTKLYRKDLYQILAESYERQGQYQHAYQAFQSYLVAKDSLLEEEKSNKIAQYTHLYESEKKKVEIAELRAQNATKQNQLTRSKNVIRFLGGGCLLLFASFFAWYYYHKNLSLEQYKQLRVQLTHDLHDNINSSLNHIKIIAGRLSRDQYTVVEKRQNLQRIRSISNDLVTNMHDLIWSLDDKKIQLVDLSEKMEDYASNIFSSIKTPYFIDNQVIESTISLKTTTKNNIYAIFKEAINNIIKHTHPKDVSIQFSLKNRRFYMSIKNDTSNRKEAASSSKIGLKSMQQRVKAINGTLDMEEIDQYFILTLNVPV